MKSMHVNPIKTVGWARWCSLAITCLAVTAQAACRTDVGVSATPSSDFTVNANGTVVHAATGLMWKQCSEGRSGAACGTGAATYLTWAAALTTAKTSSFAGYSDWRLPNKQELESLVDDTCVFPAINSTVFPGTASDSAWTSTTVTALPDSAWFVRLGTGSANSSEKTYGGNVVRLVRSGQSFDTLAPAAVVTAPSVAVPTLGGWAMLLLILGVMVAAGPGWGRVRSSSR